MNAIAESFTQIYRNDEHFEGDLILDVAYIDEFQIDIKLTVLTNTDSDIPSSIQTDTISNSYMDADDILEYLKSDDYEGEGSCLELNGEEADKLRKQYSL